MIIISLQHEYIPLDITSKPRVVPTTLYSRIIGSVECTLNSVFSGTWLNPQCGPSDDPVFYLDQQQHERGKALPRGVLGWSKGSDLPKPRRRRYPISPLASPTHSTCIHSFCRRKADTVSGRVSRSRLPSILRNKPSPPSSRLSCLARIF